MNQLCPASAPKKFGLKSDHNNGHSDEKQIKKLRFSFFKIFFGWATGLPDGIFSNHKSQFWVNLGGPWNKKNIGTLYGRLEYITAIWYILGPFGNLVVPKLVGIFSPVLVYSMRTNQATLVGQTRLHSVSFSSIKMQN
jgi:hypothetical protein